MCPAELAVGIGLRPGTPAEHLRAALGEVLDAQVQAGSASGSGGMSAVDGSAALRRAAEAGMIVCLATLDGRAVEPGLRTVADELGVPIRAYPAAELAAVTVPTPASRTLAAVATPSVAEAAAILAAGGGALVVRKRVAHGVVVAAARVRHASESDRLATRT